MVWCGVYVCVCCIDAAVKQAYTAPTAPVDPSINSAKPLNCLAIDGMGGCLRLFGV